MDMGIRDIAIAMVAVIVAAVICGVIIFFLIGNELGEEANDTGDNDQDDVEIIPITPSPTTGLVAPTSITPVPTVFATQAFVPTQQVVVQQQVVPATAVTPIALRPNCTVRTDWQPYIVQNGDTLEVIATVIGSTVNEVVLGNCIVNPDAIYVGQQLYLPSLPTTTTGFTVAATLPPVGAGGGVTTTTTTGTELLVIQPYVAYNGGVYTLRNGASVNITWANIPANTIQVDFYFVANNTPQALITSDLDITDGAIIQWTVPDQASGVVLAYAILVDGSEVTSAPMQVVTQ
jgi:hypothetical protein